VSHRVAGAPLDFAALRGDLQVPGDFPSTVLAEATRAAQQVVLPDHDRTDIPFVTVDPAGSKDLDQAVHIARDGAGYLVSYAIADVAAFVRPGSAVDVEARRRGETLYFPDARVPLHPAVLSEGAASLLPGQLRPAVLWQFALDAGGDVASIDVQRARVRSVAQLDYDGVQRDIDAGRAHPSVGLLADVGERRIALARTRHAIDLDLPQQTVTRTANGAWTLLMRAPLAVERYNAEISLLTGMCAATLMLRGGYGVLRVVPPPDANAIAALRRAALALGVSWPDGALPGDVLASLDRTNAKHVAFIEHAMALLRGAGYADFNGTPPAQHEHSGIGAAYAHVTAPLRRLVDRFGSEICLALHAGEHIPAWVRQSAPRLPEQMAEADRMAHEVDRAVVDMTEAWLLKDRVGQHFAAVVIDAEDHAGTVVLDEPAVRARCDGTALPVGERVDVVLVEADVARREVRFRLG
jgi:VacB/RNase II family 3'-5' exoribonuclease